MDKSGKSELFLYADYLEISSEEDAEALQQDLDSLYDWTQYSFLRFHPDKCVVMRYMMSSRNTGIKSFYNMDETWLKIVKSEKDLGILFIQGWSALWRTYRCQSQEGYLTGGID